MPRHLPWLNKGASSRTQVKQPPKPRARAKTSSDIDDDFFAGTLLANSSRGEGKARDEQGSGDNLPDLPAEHSTLYTKSTTQDELPTRRAHSSSPPPIQDFIQPQVEYMRTATSRFDLRDDEWMMVEDEFLETAKLFTRHLHIAEYEKMKERIEAKKKEQVQAARPVVSGGKMSVEGAMKKKAEVQEKRQRKAILEVFASQTDEEDDQDLVPKARKVANKTVTTSASRSTARVTKRPANPPAIQDPDSDDLDVSRPNFKRPAATRSASASSVYTSTGRESALPTAKPTETTASAFPKPVLSTAQQRNTTRRSRGTAFNIDDLDDYKPRASILTSTNTREKPSLTPYRPSTSTTDLQSPATPVRSSSPTKSTTTRQAMVLDNDFGSGTSVISKATAERIAKRKAEREKEREDRNKSAKLDDIPTFLF